MCIRDRISAALMYNLNTLKANSWKDKSAQSCKNEAGSWGTCEGRNKPPSLAKPVMTTSSKDKAWGSAERDDLYFWDITIVAND